ncbi:glycoside hydrolase family 28 protein [Massilia arenae]|uniref:Glycoside hydrolase family 28 protein n=1 Tax=Massilia arenae TaxID=2603288 RepID=A0A5C7G545_9BURK|nr:glycoside hydrolase family 28 protein [Massilia arenae]TXF99096.1 glycoside hydrolase family 28 protein [Massilia arenae]
MPFQAKRRALLRTVPAASLMMTGLGAASIARAHQDGAAAAAAAALANAAHPDPWKRAADIVARFATPLAFRDEDFVITAHGAKPCTLVKVKGQTESLVEGTLDTPAPGSPDCYPAIAAAIAACHAKGGGRVVIPKGEWYCAGPIVLRSNVHVHLAAGARVHFSANPTHYAQHGEHDCGKNGKLVLSRWQGNDCLNYSPMVYAINQTNIALTGEDWTSILNGQGGVPFEPGFADGPECWWDWKGRGKPVRKRTEVYANPNNPSLDKVVPGIDARRQASIEGEGDRWQTDSRYLPALSEAGVPVEKRVFGHGHFLRPCMIELIGCNKVLLQGYQVNAAPFWLHHPVACRDLLIRRVNMESLGPNSDGFDPEACDGVLVDDCLFNNGDDCIAIKSGKNLDTGHGPTRNVVIRNCVMNSGHGGVTLGSEMAGGIEHVYAEKLEFRNIHWKGDPLNTAIRLKTNMNRGGFLRHLYVRDVTLPHGVATEPMLYKPLPGAHEIKEPVASTAGAIITIDCDYVPGDDTMRIRPPQVSDIEISNVRTSNVDTGKGSFSCYQAFVLLGPVASSFNGKPGTAIPPIARVRISDSDFGTPRNTAKPWFLHNAIDITLDNVTIAGKRYKQTLSTEG